MKGCVTKMMFKNRERIWVAGAGGQVGRDFVRLLEKAEEVELIPTDIGDVDITDGDSVRLFMEMNRPEIIVNCVGMTDILACEENKDDAFRINALGARNLSVAARSFRSRIVQISTDDVFDGTTEQPYDEFDTPVPNSVYGKSKLAGENFVRSIAPKYLILRSSWVYGEGKNFVTDVLRKIENGETIQVEQGYASPTSALEAARMILRLLEEEAYGTYHATCQGVCSRYEFARKIAQLSGKEAKIEEMAVRRNLLRPRYAVLDNLMLRISGIEMMQPWEAALEEYIRGIRQNGKKS